MSKFIDLSGQRFGKLIVLSRAKSNGRWQTYWKCQCDCGNTTIVRGSHLKDGRTKSCGCLGGRLIDITGQTFGTLQALKKIDGTHTSPTKWLCRCTVCGETYEVASYNLRHGKANPCPCSKKQLSGKDSPTYIHGDSHSRLHNIWTGMLNRCRNPNVSRYECYGGRGISVCPEWHEYLSFKEWALTHGYSQDLSIDRIDVNGNYEPSNCRWITMKEQAANRRPRKKGTNHGRNENSADSWRCEP